MRSFVFFSRKSKPAVSLRIPRFFAIAHHFSADNRKGGIPKVGLSSTMPLKTIKRRKRKFVDADVILSLADFTYSKKHCTVIGEKSRNNRRGGGRFHGICWLLCFGEKTRCLPSESYQIYANEDGGITILVGNFSLTVSSNFVAGTLPCFAEFDSPEESGQWQQSFTEDRVGWMWEARLTKKIKKTGADQVGTAHTAQPM